MAANIGKGGALRVCDLCGAVDDHPRHVIAGGENGQYPTPSADIVRKVMANAPADEADRLLASLLDTGGSDRHMDCCREAGCPTGDCDRQLDGWNGKPGAPLLTHLMKGR